VITQCSNKVENDLQVNVVVNERPSLNLEKRIESKLTVSNEVFVERASIVRKNNIKNSSNISVLSEEEESWFSIEEAVYYVEASLNHDIYRAFGNEGKFYVHHSTNPLTTTINGGRVEASGTTLADIYTHFNAEISNHNPTGKTPLICNVWAEQDGDSYVLAVDITYSEDLGEQGPWSSNDDWIACEQLGKCDNTESGKDAALRLGNLMNYYKTAPGNPLPNPTPGAGLLNPVTACGQNLSGYWSNVNDHWWNGGDPMNTTNGFWPYGGCAFSCIDDSEMLDLLNDGFEVVNDYESSNNTQFHHVAFHPIAGYSTGGYALQGGPSCSGPGSGPYGHHFFQIIFGEFQCGALPW
jgi:hypothetical protein